MALRVPGTGSGTTAGPGRLTAVTVLVVSLLTALLSLTGAGSARADDPVCAPLALASFGDPGDAEAKVSVPADGSTCFTLTAEAPGLHLVSLGAGSSDLYPQLYTADGTQLDCYDNEYSVKGWCDLPAAGAYTLKVVNTGWDPAASTLTVVPLGSATPGCFDPAGTGWDQPPATRTTVSPAEVDCQPFTGQAGERIRLTAATSVYGSITAWLTDATGARICPHFPEDGEDSCVLTGSGPYRVISQVTYAENGFPAGYTVAARRLNDPQGCATAPVRPYGVLDPQDLTVGGCSTFTTGKAGLYTVHYVNEDRGTGPVQVFGADGRTVCRSGTDPCRVPAAGTYTAIPEGTARQGVIVLDRASDAGCETTGYGLHRGELSTPGQYDCLTLPAPQNARIAALTPLVSAGVDADVEVVDADGTAQCDAQALGDGDCALTGTAPYRVLLHSEYQAEGATGSYSIALHRTDAPEGCPVLPAGSFAADGAKATFTTGGGVFSQCLSIPADAHTGAELLQLTATSGDVPAKFSVLDSTGKKVCERYATTNGWTVCPLTPGKAHTVLVTGQDKAAGYTLTRRDVTASATSVGCARTSAAKVGGPSVKRGYGAAGTVDCVQVTTPAATDVLHVNVRDALGKANLMVLGGDGTSECSYRNSACAVTGSTTHQVLVQTPAGQQASPVYHLDALRIATADGPAPECTRVPSVSYGYGPVTGTLDETHSAVCAVLPTSGLDHFSADIKDTAGATATAVPALYNPTSWRNGCVHYLGTDGDGYDCATLGSSTAATPTVFLLGLPETASSTAYSARLACSSPLCGTDRVSVTGISPATGVRDTKVKVTVTGTALGPDTVVRLSLSGRTISAKADSVAADNRSVTATLDLTGAAVGDWTVSVLSFCCEYQSGGFTVTQPRLTGTTAPKITGTARVGAKVTATTGSWSAAPTSYTYQWKADGKAVSGATAASYTVPASLLGKKLTVTVTAVRSGWASGSATSAAVTVAKGEAPKATKAPTVGGTAKVGKKLTAAPGTWSPAATSYAYQWYANGKAIGGATKSTLTLKSAQKGKKITVKVTAHRTGHKDGTATSKPTKPVTG
ncbi:Tat pathway signal protein [Streptomyces sp.]|uniref:Tat pathway signal protein n=1 Tax=Streptomyces sp. TaxID=1931 RepID=UPI0025F479C8|nr:Tat pathway signal protein [Streptomyces sp.]